MFVDRLTGRIYGYDLENFSVFQITDTTIPSVYDAYITNNGTKVFMRALAEDGTTIKTTVATIPPFIAGSEPRPLTGISSLQDNVSSVAVSRLSTSFSYLVPNLEGSSVYTIDAKGKTSVTTSVFREWTLTYGGELPYMTTKASAYLPGYTVSLPNQTYFLGGKTGLLTLPNMAGDAAIASMWSKTGLVTFIFTKADKLPRPLSIQTLASKCAWMDTLHAICATPSSISETDEGLPDDWFQGTLSFSDDIYMISIDQKELDSVANASSLLFTLSNERGQPFDVTRLQINGANTSLLFTNKKNGTLWMLHLSKLILPR
jgi:hypothetical protein